MKFKRIPVIVDAEQLTWENWDKICIHASIGNLKEGKPEGCFIDDKGEISSSPTKTLGLMIPTLEGLMLAREGDWIIRGVANELYPCKPDVFVKIYEKV